MVTQDQLIKKATEIALQAVDNFIENIELNKEDYQHLHNINIACENINIPLEDSIYIQSQNKIVIGTKYINRLIKQIQQRAATINVVVINIAANIVHEIIHANRTVVELKKGKAEAKLISEYYKNPYDSDEEERENYHYMEQNFEEIITDSLSEIIIKSKDDNKLELQEITDYIKKRTSDEGIKIGVTILNAAGISTIREFMQEAYKTEPTNPFKKRFKENYDDLIYYVSEIYTSLYCEEKIDNSIIKEVTKIIR